MEHSSVIQPSVSWACSERRIAYGVRNKWKGQIGCVQAYAIEGKLPSGASAAQIPEMLQALLAERLKLTVHHATKPLLSNMLVIPKKGPKLHSVPASELPQRPSQIGTRRKTVERRRSPTLWLSS
jgi:uncharacterized protein (TIGR03435 family)